jgi:hypothetical protein
VSQTTVAGAEQGGEARHARLTGRPRAVTCTRGRRRGGTLPPVRVQAVSVLEASLPPGDEPREWLV